MLAVGHNDEQLQNSSLVYLKPVKKTVRKTDAAALKYVQAVTKDLQNAFEGTIISLSQKH